MMDWILLLFLAQQPRDPAAWGSNHAGKPVPEFVHGDECLFCHRAGIGSDWQKNPHGISLRDIADAPELAALVKAAGPGVTHVVSGSRYVRFLKKEGYGTFAILSSRADRKTGAWVNHEKPTWDSQKFGARCAGCHATGVDAKTRTFTYFGLECYTCHGVVDMGHTEKIELVWLSKKKRSDTQAITSLCAQCHLRDIGKSKSTGLPYPNNFVTGDNLFQDYQVDFSKMESLNPGDRHVARNVREVIFNGSDVTCVSCHRVHQASSQKHRLVLTSDQCLDCHYPQGPKKNVKTYEVHSEVCEY